MNPFAAYQKQTTPGQPRIDIVLQLYETLLSRLQQALAARQGGDGAGAEKHLVVCRFAVGGLASASLSESSELAVNLRQLWDFVMRCLSDPTASNLKAAQGVIRTLHDGFMAIRPQAVKLERNGQIPQIMDSATFQARV